MNSPNENVIKLDEIQSIDVSIEIIW